MTRPPAVSAAPLTEANHNAVAYVRARAGREQAASLARIARELSAARVRADADELCAAVRRVGVVTVNFHPDRLLADGRCVAEAL